MKIAFVSDTHGFEGSLRIPECDVLVHCGDVCPAFGELSAIENIAYWFEELKRKGTVGEVILVAGNHDTNFIGKPEMSKALLKRGCHYLQNEELTIDGKNFYGMSYLDPIWPDLLHNVLADQEYRRELLYQTIPEDIDVLITHHPPDIKELSCTLDGYNLGCPILLKAVERIKPKFHVFGHVHNGFGFYYDGKTTFINASNGYEARVIPVVILQ